MKIKMNYDELLENVKKIFKKAGEWTASQGYGEVQLYARFNPETGYVEEFFDRSFCGNSTWIEGENIVQVWVEKWFYPLENEDLKEWLTNEFYDNHKLFNEFKKKYKEEFDIELDGIEDDSWEYWEFQKIFPDEWDELINKWEDELLDFMADEIEYNDNFKNLLNNLEQEGFNISNNNPRTSEI
mgnify:CR=1 FL=1